MLRILALFSLASPLAGVARAQEVWDAGTFESLVRPVLVERCGECHGGEELEADFLATTPGGLRAGSDGGPVLDPGNPDGSRLIELISYAADKRMPPTGKLPDGEIELLRDWVAAGAPMPEGAARERSAVGLDWEARLTHWLWQPVGDPEPPAVDDAAWVRSDVDRFVLAKLEQAGLAPAAETDRRSWLRRVSYALGGLPPSPDEVQAFLADGGEDAYGRVVDRLLASPRFSETWARHWLDLVRYAETKGHEFDFPLPNAWQYRDYVLRALDADLPWDEFLVEHVAGDLLEAPRRNASTGANESVLGTGFWWFGDEVHSPVDPRKDETDRLANQVEVFGKAFLGLTVSCARCHDHKFDAISAADYYALCGYLVSSTYRQVRFETDDAEARLQADLAELRAEFEPKAQAELIDLIQRDLDGLEAGVAAVLRARELEPDLDVWPGPGEATSFEDFERETWWPWSVEGTAFGAGPYAASSAPGHMGPLGEHGERCVNSYAPGGSDGPTGTLTSPPILVEKRYLHLLVGGGDDEGLAVECRRDGELLHVARGKRSNLMSPVVWDLAEHLGTDIVIRIVDGESGGWGQISADRFVWSDQADPAGIVIWSEDRARRDGALLRSAAESGMDPAELLSWSELVDDARDMPARPIPMEPVGKDWFDSSHFPQPDSLGLARGDQLESSTWGSWVQDGSVFRITHPRGGADPGSAEAPARLEAGGVLVADRMHRDLKLRPGTQSHAGDLSWIQSGKTVVFDRRELETGRLAYLIRGRADVFAQLDGHRMVKGPLHGRSVRHVDTEGEWRWVRHDLSVYSGARVQIEMTPHPDGQVPLAIARIVELEAEAPWPAAPVAWANPLDGLGPLQGVGTGDLALRVIGLRHSLEDWMDGGGSLRWGNRLLARHVHSPDSAPESAIAQWRAREAELRAGGSYVSATAPALMDTAPWDEHLLVRGSTTASAGLEPRRFLTALGGHGPSGDTISTGRGSGRLQLGRALVADGNPVTPRVAVNRIWHHLFGRGLVPTTDDFGVMGEEPSHPQLLDHLARRFVEGGWSRKALIRELVLSATYRQSSLPGPRAAELDPVGALLSHAPVRRLTGEALRDGILAASGGLNEERFGPSVPVHLTASLTGRGRPGASGPLDGGGRRSVYLETRRNFLQPFLMVFDAPVPATTIGRRAVSNVPAQALALLNDPFVIEQAQRLGEWVFELPDAGDLGRIDALYLRTLGREPKGPELQAAAAFLEGASDERSGWAELAHVLFNTKEFRYLD